MVKVIKQFITLKDGQSLSMRSPVNLFEETIADNVAYFVRGELEKAEPDLELATVIVEIHVQVGTIVKELKDGAPLFNKTGGAL